MIFHSLGKEVPGGAVHVRVHPLGGRAPPERQVPGEEVAVDTDDPLRGGAKAFGHQDRGNLQVGD